MYYAMDEVGKEHAEAIRALQDREEKWRYIDKLAQEAGFEGIQVSKVFYEDVLGLQLDIVPDFIQKYRLSYHIGLAYSLMTEQECAKIETELQYGLTFARRYKAADVSIHPPYIPQGMQPIRGYLRGRFFDLLTAWAPRFRWADISLSVESHIYGPTFVFQGLVDYADFLQEAEQLGALIDISNLAYQGYSEADITETINALEVTGFHVGDAKLSEKDIALATHLPVGVGELNINSILDAYRAKENVAAVLEVEATFAEIIESLQKIKAPEAGE